MLKNRIILWCLLVGMLCMAALPVEAAASDQPAVDKRFESFCKEWLQTVNNYAARKMQFKKVDQGFIAEYDGYSETLSTRVKIADPAKKTYVGILTYNEVKLQHHGQTPDAAKQGPFDVVSQSPVTAIFMYRNGEWQN
jgi:hypothetical protein